MYDELTQIHLISPRALRQIAAYEVLAAKATEKGEAALPFPALQFDGFSGRGVRLRRLTPAQKEAAVECAATTLGPGGTNIEFQARRSIEAAKKMVAEVTRKDGLATLDGADWVPITEAMLAGNGEPAKGFSTRFEALFTPKDVDVLKSLFRRWHDATEEEVDIIEGKALPVTTM